MIHYYYVDNDQQLGPFTLEELKSKRIKKSTLVWREGMNYWSTADSIEELMDIVISEPPPLRYIGKSASHLTGTKYDPSYKPEYEVAFVGVVLFVVPCVIILSRNEIFDTKQSYEQARLIFSFFSFLIRIGVCAWVINISSRQNRNSTFWGGFAFFFPSITLFIIGQLHKLRK